MRTSAEIAHHVYESAPPGLTTAEITSILLDYLQAHDGELPSASFNRGNTPGYLFNVVKKLSTSVPTVVDGKVRRYSWENIPQILDTIKQSVLSGNLQGRRLENLGLTADALDELSLYFGDSFYNV